jgi:tRNA(Arg) A34 adenosine deaminase TadA
MKEYMKHITHSQFYVKGMPDLILWAAHAAQITDDQDQRNFLLGCVGVRNDGCLVSGKNGASSLSTPWENYHAYPGAHAEGRVLRKMDGGGVLYVARVSRKDSKLTMSRPCGMCQTLIVSKRISKVYYSISQTQYGVWYPKTDKDKIFTV